MHIFKLNPKAQDFQNGCVVTIGNFDGVHLGHQKMLKKLLSIANTKHLPVVVVLFEPQPKEVFNPTQSPFRLFGLREKLSVMQDLGIDFVACINFTSAFATLSPEVFFHHYLKQKLHTKYLVIGEDFRFGSGRTGNVECLRHYAKQENIEFEVFDFHKISDTKVSSTMIRDFMLSNAFSEVEAFLGQPYFIMGKVGYGRQLGRQLGVPTANIAMQRYKSALNGVFCVKIEDCKSNQLWYGAANIGLRPTIGGQKRMLEVHLFDFYGSLYGHYLKVYILKKIRDEQKFSSLEALKQQLHLDIDFARQWCKC